MKIERKWAMPLLKHNFMPIWKLTSRSSWNLQRSNTQMNWETFWEDKKNLRIFPLRASAISSTKITRSFGWYRRSNYTRRLSCLKIKKEGRRKSIWTRIDTNVCSNSQVSWSLYQLMSISLFTMIGKDNFCCQRNIINLFIIIATEENIESK